MGRIIHGPGFLFHNFVLFIPWTSLLVVDSCFFRPRPPINSLIRIELWVVFAGPGRRVRVFWLCLLCFAPCFFPFLSFGASYLISLRLLAILSSFAMKSLVSFCPSVSCLLFSPCVSSFRVLSCLVLSCLDWFGPLLSCLLHQLNWTQPKSVLSCFVIWLKVLCTNDSHNFTFAAHSCSLTSLLRKNMNAQLEWSYVYL